jgi:hypothetical protein
MSRKVQHTWIDWVETFKKCVRREMFYEFCMNNFCEYMMLIEQNRNDEADKLKVCTTKALKECDRIPYMKGVARLCQATLTAGWMRRKR